MTDKEIPAAAIHYVTIKSPSIAEIVFVFLVCCSSAQTKRPFTATICSSVHFLQPPQRFFYRLTMTEICFFARIFGTETSPQGVIPLPLRPSGRSNGQPPHRSSQLSSILTPFLSYVMDTVKWTVGRGGVDGGRRPCAATGHALALVLLSGEAATVLKARYAKVAAGIVSLKYSPVKGAPAKCVLAQAFRYTR